MLDESRRECRNRGVQFGLFAHRKAQNRRPVCNSTFFYTPQDPKTSFGVQFRLFAHRKASRANTIGIRQEVRTERHFPAAQDNFRRMLGRMVCNSAFLHTARPVARRRLGIRQAFRRPEMPFSTAFSPCIAAERPFPTFAKSKSVFLKQTYRENNLS